MKRLSIALLTGLLLTVISGGQAIAAAPFTSDASPYKIIVSQVGDIDGFGFGSDVCPVGCELPGPPVGGDDPLPFDAPDSPCASIRSWTHDFGALLPPGGQIISALLLVNAASIQPEIFASVLAADTFVMPLAPFNQGALGSGLVPVPIFPSDLADGFLRVNIQKGIRTPTAIICDDQFYDSSVLVMLVKLP